jgi:hypothetical protein
VTDPRIHELLAEAMDDPDESLTPDAALVLRHVAVAGGVIATIAPEYLRLRERARAARAPDAVSSALAVELAGVLAAIGRSARSHAAALEAARAAGLRAVVVFDVLDELLASLVLVTDPTDVDLALTREGLTALLAQAEIELEDPEDLEDADDPDPDG